LSVSIAALATALALALALALAAAATAIAAYDSLNINITKKTISVTGSVARSSEAIQVAYDPNHCAAYASETRRHIEFSSFHPKHAGFFNYSVSRAGLRLRHPAPRYVCAYLLARSGRGYTEITSLSGAL
jgi:hypothetical protein